MKKRVSLLAITSLIVSVLSIVAFCFLFETTGAINYIFRFAWIITGITSIILPIVSKWHRKRSGLKGKITEVLALIIGFFAFDFVLLYTIHINESIILIIGLSFVVLYVKAFNAAPSSEVITPNANHHMQDSHAPIVPEVSQKDNALSCSAVLSPENKSRNHSGQRFCKMCGGAIDFESKKCTKCGKQYFRPKRLIKLLYVLWAIFTIFLIFVSVAQYTQISELQSEITTLDATLGEESLEFSKVANELFKLKVAIRSVDLRSLIHTANFFDEHAAIVVNDGSTVYHRYSCDLFSPGNSSFCFYNIKTAEAKGYTPCPDCQYKDYLFNTILQSELLKLIEQIENE